MAKKALLIGIDYTSIPSVALNGCIYDVININRMLVDAYDYRSANITVLRDDINNATTLPTKANIINNLITLASESATLDEVWIHYSGHGSQIPDKNKDEISGYDSILVPLDYQTKGFIVDDDLLNIIKMFKCKTILIFDSCHSGSVCDLPWSFQYVSPTNWTKTKNNSVTINNPNIFMFSGCKDDQTSADAYFKSDKCAAGAFTNALITGLRYYRHNVSIGNLYQYICTYLKSNGFTQIPILSTTTQTPIYTFLRAQNAGASVSGASVSTSTTINTNMKSILYNK
jgi:metacaspase-1